MSADSRIFDSWALLAWLRGEAAAQRVRSLLDEAQAGRLHIEMSWINAGEVYYMLVRKNSVREADDFLARLPSLPIGVVEAGQEDVIAAARLKSTRRISYADAFAAGLAISRDAPLVTGDPELRRMTDLLRVEWVGGSDPQ